MDQIRIGDKRSAKGDGVGGAGLDRRDRGLPGIPIVGDVGAMKGSTRRGKVKAREVSAPAGTALDKVDEGDTAPVQRLHEGAEHGLRGTVMDAVHRTHW